MHNFCIFCWNHAKDQLIDGVSSYLESILPKLDHKIAWNVVVEFQIFVPLMLRGKFKL